MPQRQRQRDPQDPPPSIDIRDLVREAGLNPRVVGKALMTQPTWPHDYFQDGPPSGPAHCEFDDDIRLYH